MDKQVCQWNMASANNSFNNGSENSHDATTWNSNLLYTTDSYNTTSDTELSYLVVMITYFNRISYGTMITFGVPFNIISFAFFFQRCRIKARCADIYLASLAICDGLLVLVISFLVLILPVRLVWLSSCVLFEFIIFGSGELSSLILTTITIDRFMALYFPFTFRRMQHPKKAIVVVIA